MLISWCYECCSRAIIHAIKRIIYQNNSSVCDDTGLRFLCNAIHIAATAALFSLRASVKKKDAHALLRAYVKHMIWYKRRTNVLGDVYRKLKRNYEFLLLKKHSVDSFISCMYPAYPQDTEEKKNKKRYVINVWLSRASFRDSNIPTLL